MTIRAHTRFNPMLDVLEVAIIQRSTGGVPRYVRWDASAPTWTAILEGDYADEERVPDSSLWVPIPEDAVQALHQALGNHIGSVGVDSRALRQDYDSERARVDKLTDALVGIAARAVQ